MLQTTKAFLPKMIENDRGHIATIASLAGHVGISKLVDYCASKFAAVSFGSRALAPLKESPSIWELSIITGWLWWGSASGAGSPWPYEHPYHLHLPVLHPGHWHVRRCECQVSSSFPLPGKQTSWLGKNDCRWVPTLNPNDVADRVIVAIRKNEKLAVIPGFLKVLLSFKWWVNKWPFSPV